MLACWHATCTVLAVQSVIIPMVFERCGKCSDLFKSWGWSESLAFIDLKSERWVENEELEIDCRLAAKLHCWRGELNYMAGLNLYGKEVEGVWILEKSENSYYECVTLKQRSWTQEQKTADRKLTVGIKATTQQPENRNSTDDLTMTLLKSGLRFMHSCQTQELDIIHCPEIILKHIKALPAAFCLP